MREGRDGIRRGSAGGARGRDQEWREPRGGEEKKGRNQILERRGRGTLLGEEGVEERSKRKGAKGRQRASRSSVVVVPGRHRLRVVVPRREA